MYGVDVAVITNYDDEQTSSTSLLGFKRGIGWKTAETAAGTAERRGGGGERGYTRRRFFPGLFSSTKLERSENSRYIHKLPIFLFEPNTPNHGPQVTFGRSQNGENATQGY